VASVPPTQSSTVETLTRASPRTIGSLLCRSCFLRLLSAPPVSWLRAALFRRVTFRPSSQHSINNNVLIQVPPRSYRTPGDVLDALDVPVLQFLSLSFGVIAVLKQRRMLAIADQA
jgi:hypothetical protein